jgi:phosphoribosylaminoimidazolecarboxamide formyltransferase / IMP cyclohydrolase
MKSKKTNTTNFFQSPFEQLRLLQLSFLEQLRNGENQRLAALLYEQEGSQGPLTFKNFEPIRPLNFATDVSKIALTDLERSMRTALWVASAYEKNDLAMPRIAVGVKHGNACGVGVANASREALINMIEGDPQALFGGSVITNFPIDAESADLLHTHYRGEDKQKRVLAGLAAPDVAAEAYEELFRKSRALVALRNPALVNLGLSLLPQSPFYRDLPLLGAWIIEEADHFILDLADESLVRMEGDHTLLTEQIKRDILLAWAVCWTSNSNTITIAHNGRVLANAVGGQDRVGACHAAGGRLSQEEGSLSDLVAASDSFFPFTDGLRALKNYGVKVVFTTQGGEREREVAAFARDNGMLLIWVPDKLARGFYGH